MFVTIFGNTVSIILKADSKLFYLDRYSPAAGGLLHSLTHARGAKVIIHKLSGEQFLWNKNFKGGFFMF